MSASIEDVQHVVHVSTGVEMGCDQCSESVGGEHFAESINHYIEQHGYRLLHVGSEWGESADCSPTFFTVAVLGK